MQNAKGEREVIRVRKRSRVSYEKACFFTKTGTRGMDVHSKQKLKHCKRIQCHDMSFRWDRFCILYCKSNI